MSKTETKLKHYLVFRRLGGPGGRGGLDVLFFDWLARGDFSRCRITFVVPPQAVATYVEKFRQKGWPVGVAEYAYMAENVSGWQKFGNCFSF
ncbi:MAG: hypothetical protein COV67_06005 [Nitrospinae bacterium CG11_big_fil_rev_8_21_14_0_20_56_8]|nr:MAG: hypothetical protein COV67_06005 [Nitrospinae bacterium CG11_big_fil_rev_8_21_14_0_20_56_8]